MDTDHKITKRNIIFFDGICNLCNGAINFVIDHDRKKVYSFSSLQSDFSKATLADREVDPSALNTIILLDENDKIYTKSDAVFEVISNLDGGWKYFRVFRLVPRIIRDFVYDLVSRGRYSLFGRKDACRIPTPELRKRFLDAY